MTGLMENVKTINSAVRTLIVVGCMGGLGFGGWFGYENYLKPGIEAKSAKADLDALKEEFAAQEDSLRQLKTSFEDQRVELQTTRATLETTQADLEETRRQKERLATSLKLMKVDRRLANVHVVKTFERDDKPYMKVLFSEVDADGNAIGAPREFELSGDRIYIDCWVVSFLDHYVEGADELRSCSLCVFKSIYGDQDGPANAYALDQSSATDVPGIYAVPGKTEFEQQIWDNFWHVSNDPQAQQELGIRTSHGQANYVRAEEGQVYQVNLRSSGSASLTPIRSPAE